MKVATISNFEKTFKIIDIEMQDIEENFKNATEKRKHWYA